MICPKCGASMPDDAQFCASCGTKVSNNTNAQNATPHSNYSNPKPEPSKPPKKKSKKMIGGLVAAAIAFIVGSTVIGPAMTKNYISSSSSSSDSSSSVTTPSNSSSIGSDSSSSTDPAASTSVPNSAGQSYESIFSDRHIVTMDSFFREPNYAAFAKIDEEGGIDDVRYGYNDQGVVVEMENKYWYPTDGMDEASKQAMIDTLTNQFASVNSLTINVEVVNVSNYCVLTATLKGLDDPANIQAAADAGILTLIGDTQGDALLSYAKCESALLAQDYAKK